MLLWKMCCNMGSSYGITGTSCWPLRHCLNVRPSRFHGVNFQLVMRGFSSSGDTGFGSYFSSKPYRIFKKEAIGAEYGEGFESFRPDGILKVDVDFLNNRLQEGFLQRSRYSMKPDEVYGLIFSWDNVVVDGQALKLSSLRQLASQEGKELPTDADIGKVLLCGSIDEVLRKVFDVEETESKRNKLKVRFSQLYYENLSQHQNPVGGLVEWLDAVSTSHIPCAVVSNFDRKKTVDVLEHMRISQYFQAIVSEEDDMESLAHKFLSAAVKLDRKPSKCVVFEDDPRGVTAAHNCTMMAVALIGVHPAYNLGQADITVRRFSELSVINLRRLFSREGFAFMDPQKETIGRHPPNTKPTIDAAL